MRFSGADYVLRNCYHCRNRLADGLMCVDTVCTKYISSMNTCVCVRARATHQKCGISSNIIKWKKNCLIILKFLSLSADVAPHLSFQASRSLSILYIPCFGIRMRLFNSSEQRNIFHTLIRSLSLSLLSVSLLLFITAIALPPI